MKDFPMASIELDGETLLEFWVADGGVVKWTSPIEDEVMLETKLAMFLMERMSEDED